MKAVFDTWRYLAAAFGLAVAGIFELIDQSTMITLIIVLTVCMPGCRRACGATDGTVA
jgi:hypothetical protein